MIRFDFAKNQFIGALVAERLFPERLRNPISRILNWGILFFFLLILYQLLLPYLKFLLSYETGGNHAALGGVSTFSSTALGALLLLLSFKIPILALSGFLNSQTSDKRGLKGETDFARRLNFYSASVWFEAHGIWTTPDVRKLVAALSQTRVGKTLLLRLGITPGEYKTFLSAAGRSQMERVSPRGAGGLPSKTAAMDFLETLSKNAGNGEITLKELAATLFDIHPGLGNFLISRGLTKNSILGAAEWTEEELNERDAKRRWWSREFLARIPGFAKDWAYGQTFNLNRFSRDLKDEAMIKSAELVGREREVKLIESALLKGTGANLIIVGEPGGGKKTLLLELVHMITLGKIFPELEHKKVLELQGPVIIGSAKTKGEIEALLIQLLNEAVRAGNIMLAIDNFPEFVDSLEKVGVNAGQILAPYLKSPAVHIIGLADTLNFRRMLEEERGLMEYFVTVELSEPGQTELVKILEDLLPPMEAASRSSLTYQALEKIAEGAINYVVEGALPKRAVDLMEEVFNEAVKERVGLILPDLVFTVIQRITKMPLGEIKKGEREKLLNLEDELHKRVVNQEEAIRAIADAVRRARSGIRSTQKPIGTFLFLGPTGVGKTETAKSLAEIYFGKEGAMIRLDMTEYQRDEDVTRLLGSFEKREQGILGAKMKSSPYGVLLLDEFEKSHEKVKNLFLQILDEGFFSDYLGEKINMRNTIIIATSNAGSNLIWELTEKGVDAAGFEKEIVSYIQKENIFSPELINRFDAVIIFRPLEMENLKKIARLMLGKLAQRLKKQNLNLLITNDLIETVAKDGQDPAFGARPMQRFIQDRVERIIAEKIIKGEIKPGSEFSIPGKELEN